MHDVRNMQGELRQGGCSESIEQRVALWVCKIWYEHECTTVKKEQE